ncbi:MAG: hypothetical protein CMJ40_04560 [Phycisphaerae bacterium]|nr:hypothetical protein [Phycisphaerae bacterium]|tara:strand:+ start:1368 stop:2489 length:1122 start_codon:yes stop_codon:yes gene_type:complete
MINSLLIFILSLTVMSDDVVVLRDGLGERTGAILASDESSLRLQDANEQLVQIPWDQVRDIRLGSGAALQDQLKNRLDRATRIWRARSRLQRGDHALAEPIFAELFEADPTRSNETDLIIAEGLLRCRLERGAMEDALLPALEVSRLLRLGVTTDRYSDLVPVYDPDQPLCHFLPPVWVDDSKVPRLIRHLDSWDSGGDSTLSDVAGQYRFLLENRLGTISPNAGDMPDSPVRSADGESGSELLRWSILSRDESPDVRRRTRVRMQSQLDRQPGWKKAWLHFLLGISLLEEDGDGLRRQGLVQLAWLPARYSNEQPYLSGIAMAIMANELARQGKIDAARRLYAELKERFPDHPVFSSAKYMTGEWIEGDMIR